MSFVFPPPPGPIGPPVFPAVKAAIEQRHALRFRPRRRLTIRLTLGTDADALGLFAWMAKNQGRETIVPLPHLARRVTADAARMATAISIDARDDVFVNALQPLEPDSTGFGYAALTVRQGEALIVDPVNGWQRVYATIGAGSDGLSLEEPLARPVSAGSRIYPAVAGVIRQAARIDHHAGRIVDAVLDIDVAAPAYDYAMDGGFAPPGELFDCALPGWSSSTRMPRRRGRGASARATRRPCRAACTPAARRRSSRYAAGWTGCAAVNVRCGWTNRRLGSSLPRQPCRETTA